MTRISRETKQKEVIKGELKNFDSFFTAEELYGKVKRKNEDIGLATVYRLLNVLAKKEDLHAYSCSRKKVYSTNSNNHSHFICKKCGDISHISIKNIDFIKREVKGEICHMQIDTYGICKNCSRMS